MSIGSHRKDRMKNQKIRVHFGYVPENLRNLEISGWLSGKGTYLWVGYGEDWGAVLDGQSLYRLAKAIVRRFEEDK